MQAHLPSSSFKFRKKKEEDEMVNTHDIIHFEIFVALSVCVAYITIKVMFNRRLGVNDADIQITFFPTFYFW